MSSITDDRSREDRFTVPSALPRPQDAAPPAERSSRFSAWRARRRATRFDRAAARRDWVDQVPPWAFGILHRGG